MLTHMLCTNPPGLPCKTPNYQRRQKTRPIDPRTTVYQNGIPIGNPHSYRFSKLKEKALIRNRTIGNIPGDLYLALWNMEISTSRSGSSRGSKRAQRDYNVNKAPDSVPVFKSFWDTTLIETLPYLIDPKPGGRQQGNRFTSVHRVFAFSSSKKSGASYLQPTQESPYQGLYQSY